MGCKGRAHKQATGVRRVRPVVMAPLHDVTGRRAETHSQIGSAEVTIVERLAGSGWVEHITDIQHRECAPAGGTRLRLFRSCSPTRTKHHGIKCGEQKWTTTTC